MTDRIQRYIEALQTDPIGLLITLLYTTVVVLFSLILHECAHGYAAYRCGDPTAKMMGRLSLDPRKHLDPIGTLCMFLFGFGWAHPVPVNPRFFKHYLRDHLLVSVAGIAVNLALFIICISLTVAVTPVMFGSDTIDELNRYYGDSNAVYYFTNPFYEAGYSIMDGDMGGLAELLPQRMQIVNGRLAFLATDDVIDQYLAAPWLLWVQRFLMMMAQINLTLAVFNLFPIPPLDGFHIVNDILLKGKLQLNQKLFRITQFILIALMVTGALNKVLSSIVFFLYDNVLKLLMMITGLGA